MRGLREVSMKWRAAFQRTQVERGMEGGPIRLQAVMEMRRLVSIEGDRRGARGVGRKLLAMVAIGFAFSLQGGAQAPGQTDFEVASVKVGSQPDGRPVASCWVCVLYIRIISRVFW
jgi:hypothetical protein